MIEGVRNNVECLGNKRIPGAIGGLKYIWVAARFASVASEQSEENKTLFGKVLLTLFGSNSLGNSNKPYGTNELVCKTANAFKTMSEEGMEVSEGAMKFAETFGGEPSLLNQPVAIVFIFAIILYPIWFKK